MGINEAKKMLDKLDMQYPHIRKNILKYLQTKRKLLTLIFNRKEDAMTHLANI